MFINAIKKEILPFFFSGDIGKIDLHRGLLPKLTVKGDETITFAPINIKQSKLRNAYKAYYHNLKIAKDYDDGAYAKETCDNADKYASQIRNQADEERMKTLAKASNEARAAWKTQIDDLSRQIQEIAQRETELHDAKREFQKEQRVLQDEKIELEELKEELQARKARYDAANPAKIISVNALMDLFQTAIRKNQQTAIVRDRLQALDNILMDKFDTSFGNRIVTQTIDFVAVFVAAGGRLEDALDYQISTKILRKVIGSDDEESGLPKRTVPSK